MKLKEIINSIQKSDCKAYENARNKWNKVAKPLYSLGKLEDIICKIAAVQGTPNVILDKRGLVIFCADNGVIAQGVTQSDSGVTATVTENFCKGSTSVCHMSKIAGADIFPVDIGVEKDIHCIIDRKIMNGTKDFTLGPAMSREQAVKAIETGVGLAFELKEKGYKILAMGEMGIGNTTTSSAVASVLLNKEAEEVTGVGAGLTNEGLQRKINAIKKGIEVNKPDSKDPVDIVSKVGGLDIAGMAGLCLGGAACGIPVIVDGFISAVSALIAVRLCPAVSDYLVPSHVSAEPAGYMVLNALNLDPFITCGMCLGEGTGAVAVLPLLDMALAVYRDMSTFENAGIEQYVDYGNKG